MCRRENKYIVDVNEREAIIRDEREMRTISHYVFNIIRIRSMSFFSYDEFLRSKDGT